MMGDEESSQADAESSDEEWGRTNARGNGKHHVSQKELAALLEDGTEGDPSAGLPGQ